MSKKPRKKKNCNVKRLARMSKIFSSGLGVAQINQEYCHLVDLVKARKHPRPTEELFKMFTDHPHKWSILLCCFCENEGERYMKTEQVNLAAPYYQADLIEFLQDNHAELSKQCNQKHLRGVGWIASTSDVNFDLEQAEALLGNLGAWDEKTGES